MIYTAWNNTTENQFYSTTQAQKGKQTEIWCRAIRNTGEKKPAVQPLTEGVTVPRQQSWSVSACVIWGGCRGLGRSPLLQRNAVPALSLLFHVMFSECPGRAGGCQEETSRLPEAEAGKIFPGASSRWHPPCSPSLALCFRHPTSHLGNEEHSSKLLS